jgi:hypothetical protein
MSPKVPRIRKQAATGTTRDITLTIPETQIFNNLAPLQSCGCQINPLNAELNPICHLLALLGAHHILHISRIRVK